MTKFKNDRKIIRDQIENNLWHKRLNWKKKKIIDQIGKKKNKNKRLKSLLTP